MRYSDQDQVPTAFIDLGRIVHNYGIYSGLAAAGWESATTARGEPSPAAWPRLMAVVKADAYGHGLEEVSSSLRSAGASVFAAGSMREAVRLRLALGQCPPSGGAPVVVSLLGFMMTHHSR